MIFKSLPVLVALFSGFFQSINCQNSTVTTKEPFQQSSSLHIGDIFGGGKIFWLDQSGQHGLIAAESDQSAEGIAWNPGNPVTTRATGDGLYEGLKNSELISKTQGASSHSAAEICLSLTLTRQKEIFSDWYLPSRFELNLLFQQRSAIGGFNTSSGLYWSSTESSVNPETMAWEQEFKFGTQHEDDKDMPDQVRCIRKF